MTLPRTSFKSRVLTLDGIGSAPETATSQTRMGMAKNKMDDAKFKFYPSCACKWLENEELKSYKSSCSG